jgi:hypothetical protein
MSKLSKNLEESLFTIHQTVHEQLLSRVQKKSCTEYALEKLNRLEQCKV